MPDGVGFGEFSGVCGTVGMSTKMTREKSVKSENRFVTEIYNGKC